MDGMLAVNGRDVCFTDYVFRGNRFFDVFGFRRKRKLHRPPSRRGFTRRAELRRLHIRLGGWPAPDHANGTF